MPSNAVCYHSCFFHAPDAIERHKLWQIHLPEQFQFENQEAVYENEPLNLLFSSISYTPDKESVIISAGMGLSSGIYIYYVCGVNMQYSN